MSDKRYLGNIITPNQTEPAGPYEDSAAPGVWSLPEAFFYQKAGLWPRAGNIAPAAFAGVNGYIQKTIMTTLGNAVLWATPFESLAASMSCSSSTRGVWAGTSGSNTIQYTTFSTSGSAADFGDLPVVKHTQGAGCGNETRGLFCGGQGDPRNSIYYITIASTGNGADFGDLRSDDFVTGSGGFASPTRAVVAESSYTNRDTDYITIASTGNSAGFGTLTARQGMAGASNATRGLFAGGATALNTYTDVIEYVTIASTGDATDFGNLTVGRWYLAGSASSTRALFQGGANGSQRNYMDYVEIASAGNAVDFGDLYSAKYGISGCSNAHGGLS